MSYEPTNIVVIKTDQQRADTIGAHGNDWMITPNLDRIANEGVSFTNAFCCGATCISSRAAFYTGQYAHNTGCYSFNHWAHNRTWVHDIRDAGYRTAAIGKVHHSPREAMMGFEERVYVENFPEMEGSHDDYAKYIKKEGQENYCKLLTADGKWLEKCVSDVFPLDEKYHPDTYVGDMATRWIRDYEETAPFFLHIGFQGPHDPFAPSERFLRMYDNIEVPMPHTDRYGIEYRPPYYHGRDNNVDNPPNWEKPPSHSVPKYDIRGKSDSDMARMRRHYYAQITQLDEQVGAILSALESNDMLDNTLILFTSDHGENLGDHDIMYKWVMTEQTVRIPMLFRLPGSERSGTVDSGLFSHIDIGPTLLTALGLNAPDRLDGRSNWKRLTEGDSTEAPRCVYCEDKHLTMAHTRDRKLILYTGEESEEYFDLKTDPWEENNLSEDPNYRDEVNSFKADMLKSILESRYTGSLPQVGAPNGIR